MQSAAVVKKKNIRNIMIHFWFVEAFFERDRNFIQNVSFETLCVKLNALLNAIVERLHDAEHAQTAAVHNDKILKQ